MRLVKHLSVALSTGLMDMVWTMCVAAVAADNALASAVWGTATILLSAYVTLSFVQDKKLVGSAAIGGFLGTYLTVRFL